MIKWIHKNKRSLAVFLILSAVVLSMSFFGVDMSRNSGRKAAIKVDGTEITYDQFQKEKNHRQQLLADQYRQMLGKDFQKFAKNIMNLRNSQVADAMIAEALFYNEAKRLGLRTGSGELKSTIVQDLFKNNFDAQAYSFYLSRIGMSPRTFEDKLKKDLVIQQYQDLLRSAAEPSSGEIRSKVIHEETGYSVNYIEIDPATLMDKVATPSDTDLEKYFRDHQTDYEIEPLISYDFAVFDPTTFKDTVEVTPEDLEMVYADNESRYTLPEEIKARHIMLSIPKDADDAKKEELKKRAEEAHAKATAGENFASLVGQYSDDITTSMNGGDLGTLKKGQRSKEFDDQVFKLQTAGIAPLISEDSGYEIVKIDQYIPSKLKPLDEVKAEIEEEIKSREAPSYSSAGANEAYSKWGKSDKPLGEIVAQHKISVQSSGAALGKTQDPSPQLKGLSEAIFENPDQTKQLIELGERTILVEVKRYEESKLPPFAEVKEKVLQAYKKEKSNDLARTRAEEAVAMLSADGSVRLDAVAKKIDLKAPQKLTLTRKTPGSGIISQNKDIQTKIFSIYSAPASVGQYFNVQGKYVLAEVESIAPPKPEDIEKKIESFTTQAKQESSQILVEAMLNRLKSRAEIEVDQAAMADPEIEQVPDVL